MSNMQLLINQGQDVSTQGPCTEMSCPWLINSCVLLISEFHYYINATMSLYSITNNITSEKLKHLQENYLVMSYKNGWE